MIKKGRLKEIVKELRAASKMHAGQADEISEHIDDMALPMKSPLNCWKTHQRVDGFAKNSRAKGSCEHKDPNKR